MARFRPRFLTLEEVVITREGEYAHIDCKDTSNNEFAGVRIRIGADLEFMSDAEILELHNEWVAGMLSLRREYIHAAVEIPDSRPQILYSKSSAQWVPRADVLRCLISSDSSSYGQPSIQIDDKELSLEEFGQMLLTHEGWGMRITFVPDDMLCEQPEIVISDSTARVKNSYKRKRQVATRRTNELPDPAAPSIDTMFKLFLEDESAPRNTTQQSRYIQTVAEMKDCLNDYGYQSLEDYELALLENRNRGGFHQSFCELFGVEQLLDNLGEYLCYRQIRQCASDLTARKRSMECVEDLLNWLIDQGHINSAVAEIFMTRVRSLEQDLPDADRASKIISAEASKKADFDLGKLDCDDYMEFDIWIISRIERDRFWFQLEGLETEWGPALLPAKAAQLLKPGWQIACAFVRAGNNWRIAELVNIYPEERVVDLDSPYCEAKC